MATKRKSSGGGPTTYVSGPYKGVRTTTDPYDDPPDLLVDARNLYIPDPTGSSGIYARPGFDLSLDGARLYTGAENFRGQCIYSHTMTDGSRIGFVVHGGRMFRVNAALTEAIDVTPIGVTIDPSTTTRVSMVSVLDELDVNDSINRPWIASNLTSTPITGTYIDYDGIGGSWTARAPFYYGGAPFWPLIQVNGVSRGEDVSWANPGQTTIGYQQPDFDNNWTLIAANAGIIYAGVGTNTAFYFFRQNSIGAATGVVNESLSSSATLDAISYDVGTLSPQCIATFGQAIFFIDAAGRPWRLVPGSPPEPIWYQMRGIVSQQQSGSPFTTAAVSTACIEPTLNKYVAAIWSSDPSTQAVPTEMYIFDANTGTYEGRWDVANTGTGGVGIDCVGVLTDSSGRSQLVVLAEGGYVYHLTALTSEAAILTTEDGVWLTTEDGVILTTESEPAVWTDAGEVPLIEAMTGRFGYADDTVFNVDRATVTTLNDTPIRVTVQASAMPTTLEGIPEPSASNDGTYRLVCGMDAFGRGPQVTVQPLDADTQWSLQRISIVAIPSTAGPEDS